MMFHNGVGRGFFIVSEQTKGYPYQGTTRPGEYSFFYFSIIDFFFTILVFVQAPLSKCKETQGVQIDEPVLISHIAFRVNDNNNL